MTFELSRRQQAAVAGALLLGAAAYIVLVELHRPSKPATDVYAYYLPNMVYAAQSAAQGGKGLLWNPYQSGGAPFFANPETALLYPPHWLFLVLDANTALHAVLIINIVLGALGMLLLGREIGLGWPAALGGALAFELGDPMVQFAGWSPTTNAPWAFVPWALFFCERLLRAPSRRAVVGLAAVLALELLPGYPIIAVLTYQVLALRLAWELATGRSAGRWRAAAAVAAGMGLAPVLIAVQLIPAIELARASIRTLASPGDLLRHHAFAPAQLVDAVKTRMPPVPFLVAPLVLGILALTARANRRLAIFYTLTGILFAVLGLGDVTPLLRLYVQLPPGEAVLRAAFRLFWISGLSLAVLTALGLAALTEPRAARRPRWLPFVVAAVLCAGLYRLTPGGLRWAEIAALAAILAAVLAASAGVELGRVAVWVALAALVLDLVAVPLRWWGSLLPSAAVLWKHEQTFAELRPPMTSQDRAFFMPSAGFQVGFVMRTATVLRVPNLSDYDSLNGERYADYFTMMRTGAPLSTIMDAYLPFPWTTPGLRRRLLDLAAVRYLVASPPVDVRGVLDVSEVPVSAPELRVYRSDSALPRARYVPRIDVVSDPAALLHRLAYGDDDLAAVALVEEPLPSGLTGAERPARAGSAHFVQDDPEHLVIDVDAPAAGFLVIADQYYPGWQATVNGTPAALHRANYLFRLIEVPAGASRVELRFRPTSVAVGAAISAMAIGVAALLLRRS